MSSSRQKKSPIKKISVFVLSLITVGVLSVFVTVFALAYNNGGANMLFAVASSTSDVSGTADDNVLQSAETSDTLTDDAAAAASRPLSDDSALSSDNTDTQDSDNITNIDGLQSSQDEIPTDVSRTGRLFPFRDSCLWGYKNASGQIVISAMYSQVLEFADDVAFAAQNGLFGLLSREGVWLAEPQWTDVLQFSEGRAAVEIDNDKWGFIDETGALQIECQFREVGSFHCGRAAARSTSNFGYIDVRGEYAVNAEWKVANDFSDDVAIVTSESGNNYIINKVGDRVVTLSSRETGVAYSDSFALFNEGSEYYFRNSSASIAFSDRYEDALPFSNNYAAVKKDGLWGFINTKGVIVIECVYKNALSFSNGLAAVQDATTALWGYIDIDGVYKLNPAYDEAQPFSNDKSVVLIGTEYSIVDKKGTLIHLYYA